MKSKKVLLLVSLLSLCSLVSCDIKNNGTGKSTEGEIFPPSSDGQVGDVLIDSSLIEIPSDLKEAEDDITVALVEGTPSCWKKENNVLTFSSLTSDTIYSIEGTFSGQIIIDAGDDYQFELEMNGLTLYSETNCPITVLSGDNVTLTAKKGSNNYIYDKREELTDENEYSAAIYSLCDLDVQGKGELVIISKAHNGIHSKNDLAVKNLTLSVTCMDNALKGNDSVTIECGSMTLIAKQGDGIKTTDSDISSKGNQRGTVSLRGGNIDIYAATDGIDASYDVNVSDGTILNIYTGEYSPYSETVKSKGSQYYIRSNSTSYSYSVKCYSDSENYVWKNATYYKDVTGGRERMYYYKIDSLSSYPYIELFAYQSSQSQSQDVEYYAKSEKMRWNESYDTLVVELRREGVSFDWSNYTTSTDFGFKGPQGGIQDGNLDKSEYSTKGIKSANEIIIDGGTISINSYDDALHSNNDVTLENGEAAKGNVTINNGNLSLFSKDDAIHADNTLTLNGGSIDVKGSYEGLEGNNVIINGGDISVISTDDGVNATAASGVGIQFTGGKTYVYAGGDGLDSNSRTFYQGISFEGGDVIVLSTSGGNSSIDTEQGYSYTSGKVLAVSPSNSMVNETTNCKNFTSIATIKNMNLSKGTTLSVSVDSNVMTSLVMPCSLSSSIVYLGSSSASFAAE